MSRLFTRASSQYAAIATTTALEFGTGDFTIAVTVRPYTVDYTLASTGIIFSKFASGVYFDLQVYNYTIRAEIGGAQINSSTVAINTTYRLVMMRASGVMSLYLDGVAQGTIAAATNISNAAQSMHLGVRPSSSHYLNGELAEFAAWTVPLSVAEIAAHAAGFAPSRLRPSSLVFDAPMVRELIDVKGGAIITNVGTTVSDHPRIIY